MSVFVRRFLTDPGNTVLLNVESINILDLAPPSSITGVGTGTVICVGEFENGPFNAVTEVTSATDFVNTFGSLGYQFGTVPANYPCAVKRSADGALVAETWNGNAFTQLNGKQFARLLLVRADTSVGSVQFTRTAFITGAVAFRYPLSTGQILALDIGAGSVSSTFTGTAATVTASGGTYATTFVGGETLTIGFDDSTAHPDFTVTFLLADQSLAQVVARINGFAGFAFADTSGGQLRLTGIQKGTAGHVRITSASTGVFTKLGLTAAVTNGTGNVANIGAVTPAEIKSIVETAVTGTLVETDANGAIRISNLATPGTGTITVGAATTATALGFVIGQAGASATGTAGTIPAGTLVQVGSTTLFVTMQDVAVTASNAGAYSVKIRHAVDDGTGIVGSAGAITKIVNAPALGSFAVTNASATTAALTEPAIDAAYLAAIAATLDINSAAKQANLIFSARQSNQIRRALKANALTASSSGLFGRMACIRPPLNTSPSVAVSASMEPGVGATRDQRVIYCYIGSNVFVPLIAARGLAGGTGFTATGNVDVGSDSLMASICSQLPPEENPGQDTPFSTVINGLETGASVQGLTIIDYENFKGAGIAALRMDGGTAIFQSGVTSVDPLVDQGLVRISRRRMADYIQDSLALACKAFGKKLSTNARRKALTSEIQSFLDGLLSANNPGSQRIAGYTLDAKTGNTPETIGMGLFRVKILVRTLSSLDSIVLETTVGDNVVVTNSLPAAA